MQAEYYSDKSIAVLGETKPWAANLRTLGGKFNGNLKGRPGWIFPRNKEAELMQFIGQAQQGLIQPMAQTITQTTYPIATAQMVPFGQMQPAMSPQAAMTRLTIAQPQQATIPFPQVAMPQVAMPQVAMPQVARPLSPKPTTVLPPQPVTVGFPNVFTAADGLTYQIIIYTAPIPTIGQRVTLSMGDFNVDYNVTTIQGTTAPIDDILLTQILPNDAEPGTEAPVSRAIIMKGKWQIHGMQDEHSLTFQPMVNRT